MRAPGLEVEYRGRPSVVRFMAGAVRPYPGSAPIAGFPPIRARWRGCRLEAGDVAAFLRCSGIPEGRALPALLPHVLGFRLLMVVLTHRAFPLPIWRALQIRNHMVRRLPIAAGEVLDLETSVGEHRVLERGVEVDLRTTARAGSLVAWSSVTTFYYRGRFGTPQPASAVPVAPDVGDAVVATWRAPTDGGRPLAALTGDYNPIHWWSRYARRSGFARAFLHPQLAAGQCLAHLAPPGRSGAEVLDLWLKGPVYRGVDVRLRASRCPGEIAFSLTTSTDERPAIVGRWAIKDEEPATSR